ncbi:hypothetical protein apy_03610 [Aeropyrum pernix]|uniref:Uncharacterized protein n=1 Tax=Aeropyrum pernix TaxID=56636 RepID=A0A401H841_AERPX|nr:hypothetical protein apy_03610 [Aeropyrum pernix]
MASHTLNPNLPGHKQHPPYMMVGRTYPLSAFPHPLGGEEGLIVERAPTDPRFTQIPA